MSNNYDKALELGVEFEAKKPEEQKVRLAPGRRSLEERMSTLSEAAFFGEGGKETINGKESDNPEEKIIKVSLAQLVPDEFNPRNFYAQELVQQRARSLAEFGQQTPIVVYKTEEQDKFAVHEGRYRWQAALLLGWETLDAIVRDRPPNPVDGYFRARVANTEHHDQTALDDAMKWEHMLALGLLTQKQIAEKAKIQPSDVTMTLKLTKMSEDLALDLVSVWSKVGLRKAYEISRIESEMGYQEARRIVTKLKTSEMSLKQIKAILDKPSRTRQHYSAKETFTLMGGARGAMKGYHQTGRLELELEGIPAESQIAIFEEIKTVLSKYQSTDGS